MPVAPKTYAYGKRFEQLVILEIYRLNEYLRRKYKLSFFQSKDGAEIDLVLERPGSDRIFVEIKSAHRVEPTDISSIRSFAWEFPDARCYCLCQARRAALIDRVRVVPWIEGIEEILDCWPPGVSASARSRRSRRTNDAIPASRREHARFVDLYPTILKILLLLFLVDITIRRWDNIVSFADWVQGR